ncbi:hypothetical protein H9P43_009288 [Blastocladiella emersonii ATCC 22665]|nr:hypothetical protein H9P43_009288 [Blastocladiella emersonii ATCC 22665]
MLNAFKTAAKTFTEPEDIPFTTEYTPAAPLNVFGDGFCVPTPMTLLYEQSVSLSGDDAVVSNAANGTKLLEVQGKAVSMSSQRSGFDLLTRKPVFVAVNSDKLLSMSRRFTLLDADGATVATANGVDGLAYDCLSVTFEREGLEPMFVKMYDITKWIYYYVGNDESGKLVARAKTETGFLAKQVGADTYRVEVVANVDYALISAITALVDVVREWVKMKKQAMKMARG